MSTTTAPQHEQSAQPTRRDFLVSTMGGLALGFFLPEITRRNMVEAADPLPGTLISTWLRIGSDESITLTIGSSDMGQGSFTGLAQVLAEELMVDFARVKTVQGGPTTAVPAPVGTAINTVGSSVTRNNFWKMRDAGASAREMLVQAAMNSVGDQTRANYTVANGVITHTPTGATRTYGQVAAPASKLPVPANPPLVPDSQFKVIGKTVPRVDIPLKVNGSAKYGIDIRLPNMLYGIVKHCPTFGGTLSTAPLTASVAGRYVFYNNSSFDGNDPLAGPADDAAIATDKSALLPGQSATFANYTSYDKGINGVMIDIANLPKTTTLTAADFAFVTGNTADPTTWATLPPAPQVSVRRGAGKNGTDRVTLIFPDGSIVNTWLKVTVKTTSNTSLSASDVFYFGNLVGETGNDGAVGASDVEAVKAVIDTAATITSNVDFNRSGTVSVADVNTATANLGNALTMITAPGTLSAPVKNAVIPVKVVAGTNRGLEAVGNVNAVVVVGTNTWDTWRAAKSLSVSWTLPANAASLNDAQFLADAQALASSAAPYVAGGTNGPGTCFTVEGDAASANAGISAGAAVIDQAYTLPYVPHACLEVLNCTVDYIPGVKCDVYAPTQSAKSVLTLVMTLTGLAASQVNIITTYLGGGLGRKAEVDFISQAVQVGMAIQRPVKVMWPREEDFSHDQYRPMAYVHVKAATDGNGGISGWNYRNVSPSILGQRGAAFGPKGDSQGYEASQDLPYKMGARVVEWVSHTPGIPVGFWRSVGASINTFAVESMIDELAAASNNADPYLFRRNLLAGNDRWIAVLDAAAKLGGWNTPLPAGRARGIAIGTAFNSVVAQVVEVSSVTTTSVKIAKVSVALDAYLTVNPGQVEAQLVGGVVHAINATLYGKQSFLNGAAQKKNFNNNRMIRIGEMPAVAVTILPNPITADRTKPIGGVGELGVPTFAPALANACAKWTGGTRIRTLPFFPTATMGGL